MPNRANPSRPEAPSACISTPASPTALTCPSSSPSLPCPPASETSRSSTIISMFKPSRRTPSMCNSSTSSSRPYKPRTPEKSCFTPPPLPPSTRTTSITTSSIKLPTPRLHNLETNPSSSSLSSYSSQILPSSSRPLTHPTDSEVHGFRRRRHSSSLVLPEHDNHTPFRGLTPTSPSGRRGHDSNSPVVASFLFEDNGNCDCSNCDKGMDITLVSEEEDEGEKGYGRQSGREEGIIRPWTDDQVSVFPSNSRTGYGSGAGSKQGDGKEKRRPFKVGRTRERRISLPSSSSQPTLSSAGLSTPPPPPPPPLGSLQRSVDAPTLSLPSTPIHNTTFPNTRTVPDPPSLPSLSSLTGRFRRQKTAPGPSARGQMYQSRRGESSSVMPIAMPIDPNRSNWSYPSAPHPTRLADPPKSRLKRRPSASSDRVTFPTGRSGGDGNREEVSARTDPGVTVSTTSWSHLTVSSDPLHKDDDVLHSSSSPFNLNSTPVPTATTVNSAVSRADIFNRVSVSRSSDNHTADSHSSTPSTGTTNTFDSSISGSTAITSDGMNSSCTSCSGSLTNQSSDSTRHSLKPFPRTKTAAMSTRMTRDELKSNFNCLSREEQQQLSPIAHKNPGSYGWKGEWNVDNMEVVIQKLRGLKTE